MKLVQSVSTQVLSQFLEEAIQIVGKEWVFSTETDVNLYRDAYSPWWGEKDELLPSAAIAPINVDEVQKIVAIANKYKVPLYPISTGKNLGYGGSSPTYSGCVIVDLKRMNKIIEVDDERHFAIVEPGVSYYDLYNYIQEKQLRVWIDCPEPGWGSLVGNALDRGIGWTWGEFRDHFRSHCGLEAVLPNGEVIRTGMGALPGSETWGQYAHGFGPSVDGLFSQGNFGIVTKMGFWLMPEPEAYKTISVSVAKREDLIPLTSVVNKLEHSQIIGLPRYDSKLAYSSDPELLALINKDGTVDNQAVNNYAKTNNMPFWECILPFYGPEKSIAANIEYAEKLLTEKISNVKVVKNPKYTFPMSVEDKKKVPFRVAIGAPNLDAFGLGARSKFNPAPFDGHLLFAPIIPKTGEAALKATELLSNIYSESTHSGINHIFSAPQAWLYRSFVMIVGFPISRTDKELNAKSREAYLKALRVCAEQGWGEYRATASFMDEVSETYSFNNYALRRFVENLKDSIDINGVIAPGRGGIWPKKYRN